MWGMWCWMVDDDEMMLSKYSFLWLLLALLSCLLSGVVWASDDHQWNHPHFYTFTGAAAAALLPEWALLALFIIEIESTQLSTGGAFVSDIDGCFQADLISIIKIYFHLLNDMSDGCFQVWWLLSSNILIVTSGDHFHLLNDMSDGCFQVWWLLSSWPDFNIQYLFTTCLLQCPR